MAAPISATRLRVVPTVRALVMVAAIIMMSAHPTAASSFIFYSGACVGSIATLNVCGCNTVPSNTHGGYEFTYAGQAAAAYNGQAAAAYNGPACTGVAATRFEGGFSSGQCSAVGWQSVFIQC